MFAPLALDPDLPAEPVYERQSEMSPDELLLDIEDSLDEDVSPALRNAAIDHALWLLRASPSHFAQASALVARGRP